MQFNKKAKQELVVVRCNIFFDFLLALAVTVIYFGQLIWIYLNDHGKSFSEYKLMPNDSDYYLNSVFRIDDLLDSLDPYTGEKIEILQNLYFAEFLNGLIPKFGVDLLASYLLFNSFLFCVFVFVLSRLTRLILQSQPQIIIANATIFFVFFPNLFIRPISPIFHVLPLFIYMFNILKIQLNSNCRLGTYVITILSGSVLGIGYPYYGLWASIYTSFVFLYLFILKDFNKTQKVAMASTGLLFSFAWNLHSILFRNGQIENLGTTYLRFPTGYMRVVFLILFLVICFMLYRGSDQGFWKLRENIILVLIPACATLSILLSPIVTARELEFNSHITVPFVILSLLGLLKLIKDSLKLRMKTSLIKSASLICLLIFLIFAESSQASLGERIGLNLSGRDLIKRDNSAQLQAIGNFLEERLAKGRHVILVPEEMNSLLFRSEEFITLWSGASVFFPQSSPSNSLYRVLLRDLIQGQKTNINIDNRDLFGVRLINRCNRYQNFAKVVSFLEPKYHMLVSAKFR